MMKKVAALALCLALCAPCAAYADGFQVADVPQEQAVEAVKDAGQLKLERARRSLVDKVNADLGRDGMTKLLKSNLREIRRKAKTASQSRLVKLNEKRRLNVRRAKACLKADGADKWSASKLEYVEEWGKRNDRYLKGSPMAGTGYVIASAAYDTDMDPRLYSAIATIESGKGIAPYGSRYNVCGWICQNPPMYSWADAANKWHRFFAPYFKHERYPISSMHGYGGYGPGWTNSYMARI